MGASYRTFTLLKRYRVSYSQPIHLFSCQKCGIPNASSQCRESLRSMCFCRIMLLAMLPTLFVYCEKLNSLKLPSNSPFLSTSEWSGLLFPTMDCLMSTSSKALDEHKARRHVTLCTWPWARLPPHSHHCVSGAAMSEPQTIHSFGQTAALEGRRH